MSDYKERWGEIKILGKGGQGKVFLVSPIKKTNLPSKSISEIRYMLKQFIMGSHSSDELTLFEEFKKLIQNTSVEMKSDLDPIGALKVLHDEHEARNFATSHVRIQREIEAMQSISHPNIVEILDIDDEKRWYVSKFYKGGTLEAKVNPYKGNVLKSLLEFRRLTRGVALIHESKFVHRDIKPQNIFISEKENLVLGDFGLVFFQDQSRTTLSETFENVGTRDWMPTWAYGRRIEDLNPTFDVFSLGKVLWALVSGKRLLPLWYFKKPEYDLAKQFPEDKSMPLLNELLEKCIVENEEDCLRNANELLEEVDMLINKINHGSSDFKKNSLRNCTFCGLGSYQIVSDKNPGNLKQFGMMPVGGSEHKIFACDSCGNVQLFFFGLGVSPTLWTSNGRIDPKSPKSQHIFPKGIPSPNGERVSIQGFSILKQIVLLKADLIALDLKGGVPSLEITKGQTDDFGQIIGEFKIVDRKTLPDDLMNLVDAGLLSHHHGLSHGEFFTITQVGRDLVT